MFAGAVGLFVAPLYSLADVRFRSDHLRSDLSSFRPGFRHTTIDVAVTNRLATIRPTRRRRSMPQASRIFSASLLRRQTSSPLKKSHHVPTRARRAASLRALSAHSADWKANSATQALALLLSAPAEALVEVKSTLARSVVAEAGLRVRIPLAAHHAARCAFRRRWPDAGCD